MPFLRRVAAHFATPRLLVQILAFMLAGLVDANSVPLDPKTFVPVDHGLNVALERMGAAKLDAPPAVSRADLRKVLGVVTMPDLLSAYGVQESRL